MPETADTAKETPTDPQWLPLLGGAESGVPTQLLSGVRDANDAHKCWARRKLEQTIGNLQGSCIAVWGLTYKPGTDTLRRSGSVEICEWLALRGARVQAHDPAVKSLPSGLAEKIQLFQSPEMAAAGAHALVMATEWPDYRAVSADVIVSSMINPIVLDASRFLAATLGSDPRICYVTVGKPLHCGS